jgi:hypothetical protein
MTHQKILGFVRNEFNFLDQIFLAIISFGLSGLLAGALMFLLPGLRDAGELTMAIAQTISEWAGLALLVSNGTIMKTKYWWYIVASILIVLISFIFRVLHLPGGIELFFVGIILFEIVYTIRFVTQRYTSIAAWAKYLWICSWCVTTFGVSINKLSDKSTLIPAILFWITLSLFLQAKWRVARKYKAV